ncbi:hypothetical protein BC936DRAFT_138551 [Jimgerdemannia flammicorona]|uniref:DUF1688-domain-containing protein n=1 Tax=Jimgerdemannia flammicorona TaxID=994334 RepID=A0A433C5Y8_9FUNG|nr:hypothetical protein BC936DRAFT_138551 [Jimgerdemannia flammicorona]
MRMSPAPTTPEDYLKSLKAIRERCTKVYDKAKAGKLHHFDVDTSKLTDVVQFVVSLIRRDHPDISKIPPHSRWRHFDVGGRPRVQNLVNSWKGKCDDPVEHTRRILDLVIVSVLLDAGAGTVWSYKEKSTGRTYRRSEGLGIASLDMFLDGAFSSNPDQPHQSNAAALIKLTEEQLRTGFQVTESNTLVGVEGRTGLLNKLGQALLDKPEFFPSQKGQSPRPDYLLAHPTSNKKKGPIIRVETIWTVVMGLGSIWPSRTQFNGVNLGDVWPCEAIRPQGSSPTTAEHFVPFHKLSQWLTYSMIEPITKILGATVEGLDLLTGLPEYRNGGLLIDTGLLVLKKSDYERGIANYKENAQKNGQSGVEVVPMFESSDPVIVEWRALTVIYLDVVADHVRSALKVNKKQMSLAQVLEGGTWMAGRELAEISRPNTKEPPIVIKSDGTLF